MKKGILLKYYEVNEAKKKLEKELKAMKKEIVEVFKDNERSSVKQGGVMAVYEKMAKRILDLAAVESELGAKKFESMKKDAPYMKLTIVPVVREA
jgi:hypothetical protein